MRSDIPVDLERFLQLGRKFLESRDGKSTKDLCAFWDESEQHGPKTSAYSCSERWFLNGLDLEQQAHFRDWLLINSTCRNFRAWGKRAFFSEKFFVISPPLLKDLLEMSANGISAETKATALAYIRQVIVPTQSGTPTSQLITLPRYNAIWRLSSLSIHVCRYYKYKSSRTLNRCPLPNELLSLLRDIGLRVDQLHMNLQYYGPECIHQSAMENIAQQSYPCLRLWAVHTATPGFSSVA
ncbi:hypothetical protein MMC07_002490 [Pseudocyphellaria aurata]|nr:hypothetical protein [Pseudocyphellaria aurata]